MGIQKLPLEEQKELAKTFFLQDQYTTAQIAEKIGVATSTITRWANAEKWEQMRKSLTTTKAGQLTFLYDILAKMTADGKKSLEDDDPETNPDFDGIFKISKAIEHLEKEANVGEMMQTGILFLKFLRNENMDFAQQVNTFFMAFIQEQMAKAK